MKESTRVLAALGAGLVVGGAIAASGNPRLIEMTDWLAPLGTLWVNGIRMTVIPLVVSLVITGVASASDLSAVGRIGRRTLLVFIGLLIGAAIVIVPIAAAAFRLLPSDQVGRPPLPAGAVQAAGELATAGQAQDFASWVSSLLPANPIAAAAQGAMVPLILFVLLFALAIARSPASTRDPLVGFFRALGDAMLQVVRWVVWAAPLGVFALVLPLAARVGAGMAGAVGFYIVIYSLACLLVTLLNYPVVALIGRIPVAQFARAALPAQLIGVSTSSSIATLPAMVESAEGGLGIAKPVSGFVLPLAVSTFKLAAPVSWTVGALFVGWFYQVPLGMPQLATVAFAAILLAFAAPGVPRGAFLMLTPLFVAIGLPPEGIGILIAVDAIPDTLATVVNVTGDLTAVTLVSRLEGKRMDG